MSRAVNLAQGRVMVVTDLHGNWSVYQRYRDHFLDLLNRGQADILLFLGDIIHSYGPAKEDSSLSMLLDIIRLQSELGSERVMMLLGNHEFPHIYGISLTKGEHNFTPRFEHGLGEHREAVIGFLESLPFVMRTSAGVMFTHAGASAGTATNEAAELLLNYSHRDLLSEADALLGRDDIMNLIRTTLHWSPEQYDQAVWDILAVSERNDPRFGDLLRGFVVSSLEPEWSLLWDFFFTQCERENNAFPYNKVLARFLQAFSDPEIPQVVLVTGHIPVRGGGEVICDQQLRFASWAHAQPQSSGCYLLVDLSQPVYAAYDLLDSLRPMPQ